VKCGGIYIAMVSELWSRKWLQIVSEVEGILSGNSLEKARKSGHLVFTRALEDQLGVRAWFPGAKLAPDHTVPSASRSIVLYWDRSGI